MDKDTRGSAAIVDYENVAYSLSRIGIALTSEARLEALFQLIVNEIMAFAGCDACSLYIRQEEPDRLVFQATRTLSLERRGIHRPFRPIPLPLTETSVAGCTALTGRVINIADCYAPAADVPYRHNSQYDQDAGYRTVSMLSVPMRDGRGQVTGVIQLINKLDEQGRAVAFPASLEPLIAAIASQAAVAVRQAQLQQLQAQASFMFNSLLLSLCVYAFFLAGVRTAAGSFLGLNMKEVVTLSFSAGFCVIAGFIIRQAQLPVTYFGLSLRRWPRAVGESLLVTAAVLAGAMALKVYGINHWAVFRGASVVDWSVLGVSYLSYGLIAPLQEFIRSGVLQTSLERNLGANRWSPAGAVVLSSCVFGSFHIFYSIGMALLTVFSGLLWGWLYTRHRTIVGISLSHFAIGNFIGLTGFWNLLANL